MTPQQYKHEVTQNALDRYTQAETPEAKEEAFSIAHECFTAFWTDERKKDYVRFHQMPEGSVCARFKRG